MKILFITEKYPPIVVSGNRVYNLVKNLNKKHKITVFTRSKNRWFFPMPVDYNISQIKNLNKIHFNISDNFLLLPIMGLFKLGLISNSKFYFNSGKKVILKNKDLFSNFDIVVASGPSWHAFYLAEYLFDNFNLPYILDYRDPWISKNKNEVKIQKRIINKAKKVVTVTDFCVDQIKEINNYKNKINLIENGVNLDIFEKYYKNKSKPDKLYIGYAGTFANYQGFNDLLIAIDSLPKDIKKNIFLEVCGKDFNNKYRDLAKKKNIVSKFYGHVSQEKMGQILSKCDFLYCGHKIYNAVGGKIYTYLGLNKPILLNSKKDSQLDLEFKRNKLGRVSYSIKGLSENIKQIYIDKKNKKIKKYDLQKYIKNFDWSNLAKKYDKLIGDVKK